MALELVPSSFWQFPSFRFPISWGDDEDALTASSPSGLSVSGDGKNVYVEAAVPGVEAKDVEVTFDKGVLWIKGETKKEEKDKAKKYYRKASSSFSYRVAVPAEVDSKSEPEASVKNGVMTVTFAKTPVTQPKRISVKSN